MKDAKKTKKTVTKKSTAKKSVTKKPTTKKTTAKKPTKKTPAKKTPAKKTPAKKTPAKKTPAKKTTAKKTTAKKTTAKKTLDQVPVDTFEIGKPKPVRKVKIEETQELKDKRDKRTREIESQPFAKEIKVESYMGTTEEWDKWNARQTEVLVEVYNTDGLKKVYASRKRKERFNSFFKKIKLPFRISVIKEDKVIHESIKKTILKLSQFNDAWLKDAKEAYRNTPEGILANDIPHLSPKQLRDFLEMNQLDKGMPDFSFRDFLEMDQSDKGDN